ncbi:MASE1 domain-containing protein [Xanthomonas graminis]|uniref:MASE1 domain-containing protein n=1 Tax=Xanthomonas graminis TaxID=3390026 RepID=UPI001F43D402|nr:MASE1 domain-containing protein [Xanthomonas translucens]UKE73231.1 MASE1 domain-containing protein [Xanthomonas translucens pv. phleipratensis]
MEVGSNAKSWGKGFAFSVGYGALMFVAWHLSVDQWHLAAGLRALALLLVPVRYWPFALVGDAAAVMMIRAPKAEQYSDQWAYLGPMLVVPLIAIVPALVRRWLGDICKHERFFPLIAIVIAVWTSVVNMALNQLLDGPIPPNTLGEYLRYALGQYQGILIFVPPAMVWLRRKDGIICPRRLLRDLGVAAGMTTVIYGAANLGNIEPALRQLLLLMMIVPAVVLTFLHGWRGAALGVSIASVAYGLPTTAFDAVGAHDAVAFAPQQALALAATALFALGAVISVSFDRARRLGVAERHALKIAHSSFAWSERNLRERVVALAQIQAHRDESRAQMIQWLEDVGHASAAAALRRTGAADARLFDEHAAALYPLRIEQHGLYDVLQGSAFSTLWAAGCDVRFRLRGRPRALSVDLQLAAYRCVCNAVALLAQGNPSRQVVRTRVWLGEGRRGIVVSVTAMDGGVAPANQTSMLAALELEGRLNAHGGAMKRRRGNRMSFLLVEPAGATSVIQREPVRRTTQNSPLAV